MASDLQGFLSKFNSSEGLWVDTIDPLNTFDVKFKFYPMKKAEKKQKKNFLDKALDKAVGAAQSAVKNGLNNLTGGLLGAAMNDGKVYDVMEYDKEMTFIDYISRGNMIGGSSGWLGGTASASKPQCILDLSYYIQNIQLPQIQIKDDGVIETMIGDFPVNGKYVKPVSNVFTLEIINTKASLAERIFYPWLREVTLPYWVYDEQPYSTADVVINFKKHADLKYLLVGCRPQQIESLRPSNELQIPIRSVNLIFDYMFVISKLDRCESFKHKLSSAGKAVLGSASGLVGL